MMTILIDKVTDYMTGSKELSICIPAYEMGGQGANFLRYSLDKLMRQDYRDFEVIVVDNNSKDGTIELARKTTSNIKAILLPNQARDGKKNFRGAQINYGTQIAKGDRYFFPDADMTFNRNLLEEADQLLK